MRAIHVGDRHLLLVVLSALLPLLVVAVALTPS